MKKILMISVLSSLVVAAPKIKVDQENFDFGTIPAGNGELRHSFKVSNIGDEILKIEKVKPGCSCTVVEFKSELQPGETSAIVAALSIKDRTGQQDKPITVISNAENSPLLKLSLEAFILGPINMDRRYGIFQVLPNKMVKDSITILSTKKDLKIPTAWYEIRNRDSDSSTPAKKVPVNVVLTPTKKKQSSGATEFKLVFFFKSNPEQSEAGTIYFKTNHPDSPQLEFRCMTEKR